MSSILEALKKLEAEKNAQMVPVEEPPLYEVDYSAGALLGSGSYANPTRQRFASVTLVLAGGFFAVLLIAVSVLIAMLLLRNNQPPAVAATVPVAPLTAQSSEAAAVAAIPALPPPVELAALPTPDTDTTVEEAPAPVPERSPAPPRAPRTKEVTTVIPITAEVRYEPYIPKPAAPAKADTEATPRAKPLPADIRQLPMLSRTEREQYRLENIALNMLNEANALRPTGNAIINLEKVFVGETLPGSNAKLVEVQSHGIAIEIMSTHQRYYIPR